MRSHCESSGIFLCTKIKKIFLGKINHDLPNKKYPINPSAIKSLGFEGYYYRVYIAGHVNEIPCKVKRKISTTRLQKKDVLNIFGVHLKSKRGDGNDPEIIEKRYHEVQGLVKIMKKERKLTKLPYILCGDLNGPASEKNHEFEFDSLYEKTSLKDIYDLNQSSDQDRYSYVRFFRQNIEYTQIDYIFLSKELHSRVKKVKRWLYRNGEKDIFVATMSEKDSLPSDHYPQSVIIKI